MRWPLALVAAAALCAACGPKLVRETVMRDENVLVELRETVDGGEVVPRGYSQPATIADVRLAHILASITHEDSKGKRVPTIRSSHIYELAEGIAKALLEATPDQEVMAAAFSRDRRLGIFTDDHVTILSAYLQSDELVLQFYGIEKKLDRDRGKIDSDSGFETPDKLPSTRPDFRLIPGEGQTRNGARGLTIHWRDPYYRDPVSLRYRFGQVRRRTILLEQEDSGGETLPPPGPDPDALSDEQLRALDQLEAARYAGYLTESEYQRRRRLVLAGKVDEAGYGTGSDGQ